MRAQQSPAPSAHDLLHEIDDAFVGVFQKVAPAVVIIEADKKAAGDEQDRSFDFYFHSPEGGEGGQSPVPEPGVRSEGSGFIVRADGYIYTNYHVVEDSDNIEVKLYDTRRFMARLVGADRRTDIAVLKIDAKDLPVAEMLDSDSVRIGQMCFAIGIPYNLSYSFCRGIVSGKGRGNLTSTPTDPMYEDYIQTDAFINPGNSGGPLFDIDGRVMGMNTLINGIGRGLSFAIPSNMLTDVGNEIIATGHVTHAWLGVKVYSREDELDGSDHFRGVDSGVCVDTIVGGGPAYKTDLRPLDIITKVDGVPVTSARDLQHEVLRKKVGQSVDLSVWRAGRKFDISVVTDALPTDLAKVAETKPNPVEKYGLEFSPEHPGSPAEQIKANDAGGAEVSAVVAESPASRAGVLPGDIIKAVDGKSVTSADTCMGALSWHQGSTGPALVIIRGSEEKHLVMEPIAPDK